MSIFSAVWMGLREIWGHKLRSLLTLLCVLLGVASVVVTVGYMRGLTARWRASLAERGGIERVTVDEYRVPQEQEPFEMLSPGHRVSDAANLRRIVPDIRYVVPKREDRGAILAYGRRRDRTELEGATWETQVIKKVEPERGRFITDQDNAERKQVMVLGRQVRDNLFGREEDPMGKHVRVGSLAFEVVGLMPEYELMFGEYNALRWKNDVAYIPVTTFLDRIDGSTETEGLDIQIADGARLTMVTQEIENAMRGLHRGIEDFRVETSQERADMIRKTERNQVTTGAAVSMVTILIGGIGIMNLMLASINERVREIGVRKAVGARAQDIFFQFSIESVTLCMLGGFAGVFVGQGVVAILQKVMEEGSPPVFTTSGVVMGFGASVVIGILAGLYPAIKAAKMDPIEALRYE